MGKFLDSLPEVFRERYLDTHERYLKSIADIIAHLYAKRYDDWKVACDRMLIRLARTGNLPRRWDVADETLHFRNLRNSWYHECALHHPIDDIDNRLLFAAWKIIQCYYAVFSSIASLVCLERPGLKSHDKILNFYITNNICNQDLRSFTLPPANFHLDQQGTFSKDFSKMINWRYANSYHIPNIKECLEYTKREIKEESRRSVANIRIGIPHYLKVLRDWANYQDAYLFFRLYGSSVKENLDFSLKRIAFIYCVQTEFFLMKTFGWRTLKLQFATFSKEMQQNLGIESPPLRDRFEVYKEHSPMFKHA
jgi:hypothetical protein